MEINKRVEEAIKKAITHSVECDKRIKNDGLHSAIEYCKMQGIEPPQCSLSAQSPNADKQRAIAERMLLETKWWKRRLKNKALQDFEQEQINLGNVTNYISDELSKYNKANRR